MLKKPIIFCTAIATFLLFVLPSVSRSEDKPTHILILFDMSHSMTKPLPHNRKGPAKIELARQAFGEVISTVPDDVSVGFRIFGHTQTRDRTKDCTASKLTVNFGSGSRVAIADFVKQAKPEGDKTPITYAMEMAMQDMQNIQGPGKIILISDGEENCDQDPEEVAEMLQSKNISVDTIGIGSPGAFAQLGGIALAGGGKFSLAENLESLKNALKLSLPGSGGWGGGIGSMPAAVELTTVTMINPMDAAPPEPATGLVKVIPVPAPALIELEMAEQQPEPVAEVPVMSIEIILDASGSMMKKLEGQNKIDIAKAALRETVSELDTPLIRLAFRSYGFDNTVAKTPAASCPNTELLVPFGKGDPEAITAAANGLNAYGYTPIAKSLELAGLDLKAHTDSKPSIILISDGEETCDGDPVAVIKDLRAAGIDVQVHVIGFDIDAETRRQLKAIAKEGNGLYFDAADYQMLINSMQAVIDSIQNDLAVMAPGRFIKPIMGGPDIERAVTIAPGRYTLKDHVLKNQGNYYFVETQATEYAIIRAYIQAKGLTRTREGELAEAKYALGGFSIVVFTPDREKIKGRKVLVRGEIGSQAHSNYMDLTGRGFYFSIGDDYTGVHKDALFDVEIFEAGDMYVGSEAPDLPQDTRLIIPRETGVTGHLGLEDDFDAYRINGPFKKGDIITLNINFAVPGYRFRVDVYDSSSQKRLKRFTKLTESSELVLELGDDQDQVFLTIKDNNPKLYNMFSSYTVKAGVQ